MGLFDRIRSFFGGGSTSTETKVEATTKPSKRVVDVGTSDTTRTGSITVTGSSGGSGGTVTRKTGSARSLSSKEVERATGAREQKTTVQDLPARQQDPVRALDVGSRDRTRVGGFTLVGTEFQDKPVVVRGSERAKRFEDRERIEVELKTEDPQKSLRESITPKKEAGFRSFSDNVLGFDLDPRINIDLFPFGIGDTTTGEIGAFAREKGGLPGATFDVLLPKTDIGGAALIGGGVAISKLPVVLRFGASSGISFFEGKRVLDPTLPTEERIASGIIGGAAGAGAIFEGVPFARGIKSRFSTKFSPVKEAPEGFEFIKTNEFNIGLILEKSPARTGKTTDIVLPSESPLVKGGFGRKPGGEEIFLGKDQALATSQRGLFKEGKNIPLEKEFFVTPEEPFVNIAETRLSRLGLQELFKSPKDVEIGFGLPGKPQIGVVVGDVGRKETATQFVLGKGTELEAIKTTGTIQNIEKIGVTSIRGQGVDIFKFDIGKASGKPKALDRNDFLSSTRDFTRVSGEASLGVGGSTQNIFSDSFLISKKGSGKTSPQTDPFSFKTTDMVSQTPTKPTPPFSPPKSPPKSPPLSPPFSPTVSPPTSPPVRPPFSPPPSRPPVRINLKFGQINEIFKVQPTRKFKETPSLFGALAFDLGLAQPKARTKEQQALGVPLESPFKKVNFDSPTLLSEVKRKKKQKVEEFFI